MARGKSVIKVQTNTNAEIALENFLKEKQARNLRPSSLVTYRIFITEFVNWLGDRPLSTIDEETVDDYIIYLQSEQIKSATLVSKVRNARAFLYYCMRENLVPTFTIHLPRQDDSFKEPYTNEELRRLLKEPTSSSFVEWRTWCLEGFLIGTGCRISTALAVRVSELNFEESYVNFTHLKNRHVQSVPVSSALAKMIKKYLSLWEYTEDSFLFNNSYVEGNERISIRTAQQEVARYNKRRDVSKTSCHLFRHTFAKNYIMAGGGVFQLQRLLGHADISTTRHYVSLYNSDLQINYNTLCPLDMVLNQ